MKTKFLWLVALAVVAYLMFWRKPAPAAATGRTGLSESIKGTGLEALRQPKEEAAGRKSRKSVLRA
jgi:hypothetical protein